MPRTWNSPTLAVSFVLLVALASAVPAAGASPEARIREIMAEASVVFRDPELQGAEREPARRERVHTIIADGVDFRSMARESLGSHWNRLTPAQRDEFVRLFADLFQVSYSGLVLKFLGEREAIYEEEAVESTRALVRTALRDRQGDELPVDYRLVHDGREWLVFDVIVDGVSIAANYRGQFTRVIENSSYEALIERIDAKVKLEK